MRRKLALLLICVLLLNSAFLTACGKSAAGDWWVMAEDYEPGGIPAFEVFKMGDDDDIAVYYDRNGQAVGEMDVIREKGTITLDLGFAGETFRFKKNELLDEDTGEVVFVRTDDPGFPEMLNYDGSWYLNGDPDAGEVYIFNGDSYEYKNTSENYYGGDKSGTWKYGASIHILPTGNEIETLPSLEAEFPGPVFQPVADGEVMYVESSMEYKCYISENSAVDSTAAGLYAAAAQIMSGTWVAQCENYSLVFNLTPSQFQIIPFAIDENGFNNPSEEIERWAGSWELDEEDGSIVLDFLNGETESIPCDAEADEISITAAGVVFERQL